MEELNITQEFWQNNYAHYNINILTTTALDYQQWENYYPEGETMINGLKVIRFATKDTIRNKRKRQVRRVIGKKKKYFKFLRFFGLFHFFDKTFNITKISQRDIDDWIKMQGPHCPDLVHYIQENKSFYDAFIFFTYLYYPTYIGMKTVSNKSIFIPTAHNEPPLYTDPYKNIFSVPRFIMYNTKAECLLVENYFKNAIKNRDIAGVGIEKYKGEIINLPKELENIPYFIYIGRIDKAKGCEHLLEYFIEYKKKNPYNATKLVLIGKNFMEKEYSHPDIIYTGFVTESQKYSILKRALAMLMPSFYESLSLVTLEAMNEGIPVIVNGECEVLTDHIKASGCGAIYHSQIELEVLLNQYISKPSEEINRISKSPRICSSKLYLG